MTHGRRRRGAGGGFSPPLPDGSLTVGSISTITDNTKYNAWPVAFRTPEGDLLLAYTRADSHHADNTGVCVAKRSTDEGVTWGSETTIYDHASLWTSVYGLGSSSSGRIFATLWRDNYSVSGTGEAGIVYSDDDGASWSSWIALSPFSQDQYGAGPAITCANGDLLVTIEGTDSGSIANRSCHTLRSTDDGLTWGSEVTVRDYVTDTRPYYESKLLRLPNVLLCIHRTSGGTGTHYISRSTDDGATWSAPTSEFDGYGAPSTIRARTGTLICVTRRNSDASVVAFTSTDDGLTWGNETVLDATMFEMEYACPVQLDDGRVLVVYGSQPTSSTTNSDIKQVYLTEGYS